MNIVAGAINDNKNSMFGRKLSEMPSQIRHSKK